MPDDYDRALADLAALRAELSRFGADHAVVLTRVSNIEEDVREMRAHAEATYVSMARYRPVENLIYGAAGLVLSGFIYALVNLFQSGAMSP
jgi:hypothetical protein